MDNLVGKLKTLKRKIKSGSKSQDSSTASLDIDNTIVANAKDKPAWKLKHEAFVEVIELEFFFTTFK